MLPLFYYNLMKFFLQRGNDFRRVKALALVKIFLKRFL